MSIAPSQFALNPIQWLATPDGWVDQALKPPLERRLPVVAAAGFTARKSEVPIGMTAQTYRSRLDEYGIRPGPGYVPMPWFEEASSRAPFLERARTVAATNAALEVPLVFLAMGMDKNAARVLHPGVGFGQTSDRLESIRDYLAEAAQIMVAEGAVPALHPHVGTWIETADETRFVLDTVDENILKFGPDSGHLAWTGIDPAEIITEYAPRVAGIHIKDYFEVLSVRSRTEDIDYRSTVLAGFWTEPGYGDANVDEVLDAAGPGFDGWVVVEVDRGTVAPEESIRRCGEWLTNRFADTIPI